MAALCCRIGVAAPIPPALPVDLGPQLMLRLFGETGDGRASVEAAFGSTVSESPLRAVALQVTDGFDGGRGVDFTIASLVTSPSFAASDGALANLARAVDAGALTGPLRFAPPSAATTLSETIAPSALLTETYQPVAPAPNISPAPGTLAFGDAAQGLTTLRSVSATPAFGTTPQLQLGNVRFHGEVTNNTSGSPQLSLGDTKYGAAADFDVRAGSRNLAVNIGTHYEHLARNDPSGFAASTADPTTWQLPNANAPLVIPNYANMSRVSVGAGLAVPLVHGLTLNLNYDTGHLFGGYGLPGLMNLDAVNNSYGGRLTFDIPGSSSKSLSISAYQDRFTGTGVPSSGSTQLREDVNFTVKF
ncbi:MAG: hypothetical protein JO030_07390 [Candidatus Eremiobacteraeota bacterium]|nr:hypothetical protein [Candidatus Eremiobacteraeota bacterium]